MRWDPYILFKSQQTQRFFKEHFSSKDRRVLFILGKGFDIRMNIGIISLSETCPNLEMTISLINYNEGIRSPSLQYKQFVDTNMKEINDLIDSKGYDFTENRIEIWKSSQRKKRRVGDRQISNIFQKYSQLEYYSDIIIDISALPRSVYFSLIGKILSLLDEHDDNNLPNLFVITSENAELDSNTLEQGIDEDLDYPYGFRGEIDLESNSNLPTIWFPLLGENRITHLERANQHIRPSEICPLLPFPSEDPRRSDNIFIEYHEILVDNLRIEPQDIMYVPEQNPFEVYKILVNAINKYNSSLVILGGCNAVITTLSSKLMSIGALLAAFEFREIKNFHVGILNVDCQGYELMDMQNIENLKKRSELFVTWLAGDPYDTKS